MDPVAGAGALTAVREDLRGPILASRARRSRGRHAAPARTAPPGLRTAWTTWTPVALLVLGAYARLVQWNGARSLWLDEALIARSLVSRGYGGLVAEPLQGEQAAPVLWLWASRLSIDLFGQGERALRLVSLLAGLAVLVLAWRLARQLLPDVLVPVAVALTVLSPSLLYYSNEVKPYSLDVAVVLALVLLALRAPRLLPVAGAVAVWASFASVFALAGLSVVLVLEALRAQGRPQAVRTAVRLSAWVLSLGVAYVTVLRRLADSDVLSSYWAGTFPDGVLDLPAWLVRRAVGLVADPLSLDLWPLALLLLAYGAARLRATRPGPLLLATAAVPVGVVAAALSAYPFAGRLALWLAPLSAVLLAAAVPPDLRRPRLLAAVVAGLLLVTGPSAVTALQQTRELRYVNEIRPVLEELARLRQPDDLVLVDLPARPPFEFYSDRTGVRADGVVLFVPPSQLGGQCRDADALRGGGFAAQRVWLVFAHLRSDAARNGTREDLLSRVEDVSNRERTLRAPGALAVLFDPSAPSTDEDDGERNPRACLSVVRAPRS